MNRRTLYFLVPVVIIAIGALAMVALLSMRESTPRRATEPRTRLVSTMIVEPREIAADMTAFGRVRSSDPIQLIAEVSGTLLNGDVPFKPAQTFRRGDLLVKIDDRQTRLEISSTKSDLLTALAQVLPEIKLDFPNQYPHWQAYFDSCSFDHPLPELPQVTDQKIKLFLARFNVYKLYFAVRDLEIKLEKHSFYAPFDGSVVTTNLRPGSIARQGSVLGEIISLEQLEVEVPLPAADLAWVDTDRPVRFTSREHDGEWTGRILRVGSDVDTRTQSVPVYMIVDSRHDGELLNGVFLEANIPGPHNRQRRRDSQPSPVSTALCLRHRKRRPAATRCPYRPAADRVRDRQRRPATRRHARYGGAPGGRARPACFSPPPHRGGLRPMRSLVNYFIRYPIWVTVLFLGIIAFGLMSLSQMRYSFFPEITPDIIRIQVVYPGASPSEVAEGVVLKIEENLDGLEGVERGYLGVAGESRLPDSGDHRRRRDRRRPQRRQKRG